MSGARIVHLKYKTPISQVFRSLLKKKAVIVSIALILVGIFLIGLSYNYPDTIVTPNKSYYSAIVTSTSPSVVKIQQPYNRTETVFMNTQNNGTAHYMIMMVNRYTTIDGNEVVSYSKVTEGNVTGSAVIHLGKVYSPSQSYDINLTAVNGQSFQVQVSTLYNVTLKEDTSKYIGGSGLLLIVGATISLSYMITAAMERREQPPADV